MRAKFGFVGLVTAALAIGSLVLVDAASACKGKKPSGSQSANQQQELRGQVVSVNNNSITVAVHRHHKKGQAAAVAGAKAAQPETETFPVARNAQIAFAGGKSAKAATVNDLQPGVEVMLKGSGGVVEKIAIMHHEHHKKAAA